MVGCAVNRITGRPGESLDIWWIRSRFSLPGISRSEISRSKCEAPRSWMALAESGAQTHSYPVCRKKEARVSRKRASSSAMTMRPWLGADKGFDKGCEEGAGMGGVRGGRV